MPDLVLLVAILVLLADLLLCYSTFNRLVRIEHDRFRDDWLRDGSPNPWLVGRARRYSALGVEAKYVATVRWLLTVPTWAKSDVEARRLVQRYRLSFLVWIAGIAVVALSAGRAQL